MRALVPTSDSAASVVFDDVDDPAPAPNEAVIAVSTFSVNRGETFLLESPEQGWRPGKDVAGVIEVAAADGSGPSVGTRVVAHPPESGWAQRVAVPTGYIVPLPDSVSYEHAAALPLAGLTALRLLRRAGSLIGTRLLITGASGGVGHYLTEIATASGAEVTAVSRTVERGSQLEAYGATVVTSLAELSGQFDVAFESVGGDAFHETLRLVRPHGKLLWFGQASKEPGEARFFDALGTNPGVQIEHFSYWEFNETTQADLSTLVRLTAQKSITPLVGVSTSWENTAEVITELRGRAITGNAVLLVS